MDTDQQEGVGKAMTIADIRDKAERAEELSLKASYERKEGVFMSDQMVLFDPAKELATVSQYADELAQYARDEVTSLPVVGGGNFISVKGGIITFGGEILNNGKYVNVVVLAKKIEHAYFEGDFDPEAPQSPVCYAFGDDEKTMYAHENSEKPQNMMEGQDPEGNIIPFSPCHGCKQNKWGSAGKGRGKACKNRIRLALLAFDGLTSENFNSLEIAYLNVPVTSVANFAKYSRMLAQFKRPPFTLITQIIINPIKELPGWDIEFKAVGVFPDDWTPMLIERHKKELEVIEFPYAGNE